MLLLASLVQLIIKAYLLLIILRAVMSWVNPARHHPVTLLLERVTEPLLRPIRSIVGIQHGIDFSPLVAIVLLTLVERVILGIFASLA